MKPDQLRVRNLLTDTISLLCKNGLLFEQELRIEGLLGITTDNDDVFFLHISENIPAMPGEEEPENSDEMGAEKTTNNSPVSTGAPRSYVQKTPSNKRKLHTSSTPIDISDIKQEREINVKCERVGDRTIDLQEATLHLSASVQQNASAPLNMSSSKPETLHFDGGEPPTKRQISDTCDISDISADTSSRTLGSLNDLTSGELDLTCDDDSQAIMGWSLQPMPSTSHQIPIEQSRMIPHPLFSRPRGARYPNNSLRPELRHGMRKALIEPILESKWAITACRLIWRVDPSHVSENEEKWFDITGHRNMCDSVLVDCPGVAFFFSSITGMFNKPNRKGELPGQVHPAIAYWVVLDPNMVNSDIISQLSTTSGVPCKTMKGMPCEKDIDQTSSDLAMVMKDHNSRFIMDKLMTFIETNQLHRSERYPTRLVIVDDSKELIDIVKRAFPELLRLKLVVGVNDSNGTWEASEWCGIDNSKDISSYPVLGSGPNMQTGINLGTLTLAQNI